MTWPKPLMDDLTQASHGWPNLTQASDDWPDLTQASDGWPDLSLWWMTWPKPLMADLTWPKLLMADLTKPPMTRLTWALKVALTWASVRWTGGAPSSGATPESSVQSSVAKKLLLLWASPLPCCLLASCPACCLDGVPWALPDSCLACCLDGVRLGLPDASSESLLAVRFSRLLARSDTPAGKHVWTSSVRLGKGVRGGGGATIRYPVKHGYCTPWLLGECFTIPHIRLALHP